MRSVELTIEDAFNGHPDLFLEHYAAMAVILMKPIAKPCEFVVRVHGFDIADLNGTGEFILGVTWNSATENVANRLLHPSNENR